MISARTSDQFQGCYVRTFALVITSPAVRRGICFPPTASLKPLLVEEEDPFLEETTAVAVEK